MDIPQLRYLVEIVQNKFNLSVTSQRIHLSQPALSQSIRRLESDYGVELFNRSRGRLVSLTAVGERVYHDALEVLEKHEILLANMRQVADSVQGHIRIGIPPLVLSVLFTDVLAELIAGHPNTRIEIIEEGAFELRRMLQTEAIDCAIILEPTDLSKSTFEQVLLFHDSLSLFMSKGHPLARKKEVEWTDLRGESFVLFDESYLIHHQVKQKFRSLNIELKIALTSKSWDFLLESVRHTKFLTFLPKPIEQQYNLVDVIQAPLVKPLDWDVVLVYPKKNHYSALELAVQKKMNQHFHGGNRRKL